MHSRLSGTSTLAVTALVVLTNALAQSPALASGRTYTDIVSHADVQPFAGMVVKYRVDPDSLGGYRLTGRGRRSAGSPSASPRGRREAFGLVSRKEELFDTTMGPSSGKSVEQGYQILRIQTPNKIAGVSAAIDKNIRGSGLKMRMPTLRELWRLYRSIDKGTLQPDFLDRQTALRIIGDQMTAEIERVAARDRERSGRSRK